MPKVRRQNLPPALLDHLINRIQSRDIAAEQLGRFADCSIVSQTFPPANGSNDFLE
jgi:hypothetical protein